jgi:TetR/AcrR family transcriptional repressor of nem operon
MKPSTMNSTATLDARRKILETAEQIIGQKGFSAVGLNEVLQAAKVPKGSFYHYFSSKDAFGEALLEFYFESYLAGMDRIFQQPGISEAEKLMSYWQHWINNQTHQQGFGKCLAVKLGAEVADLSDAMRHSLERGTAGIIQRLAAAISRGLEQGSIAVAGDPQNVASRLYQMWLGASVMAKITRSAQPFDEALAGTSQLLAYP